MAKAGKWRHYGREWRNRSAKRGPAFGYVLEGEYEWAIDDKPVQKLKAGDTFYEPTGCLHRVSKNPSHKNKTRVIAVVLHPHDAKDIVIPEKKE